jgi:hypothetical protein
MRGKRDAARQGTRESRAKLEVVLNFEAQGFVRSFFLDFVVRAEGATNGVNLSAGLEAEF